jgi:DNA-binding LacI/PurR family transcriptional regulator
VKHTIYDVAKEAGVSIATVSKVINNTGRISDKTRTHVNKVMARLQYEPNMIASALMGKITYTIGLTIPDLANPFFAEIARAVEDRAQELGFSLVICSTDNNPEKELKYINLLIKKRVDGIVLVTSIQNDTAIKELITKKLPITLIAREMQTLAVDTVLVDDYLGGIQATSHLIAKGHKRIAVIAENMNIMSSKERIRGYRFALNEANIKVDSSIIMECDFSIEGGKEISRRLLTSANPPTAIFACNDLLATGVIQAARELNIDVPAELSVVGFDNTIIATLTDPSLTTIAQPIQEIGRNAVDLLIKEIKSEKTGKQRIVLHPELVERGSTSKAPVKIPDAKLN